MIKYHPAPDIMLDLDTIVRRLGLGHVNLNNVVCIRSTGSNARYTIARCWGLPKIWQVSLGKAPHYVVEVISERYDRLPQHEKEKVLIHELWHIPRAFKGGLKKHDRDFGKTLNNSFLDKLHQIFVARSQKA